MEHEVLGEMAEVNALGSIVLSNQQEGLRYEENERVVGSLVISATAIACAMRRRGVKLEVSVNAL